MDPVALNAGSLFAGKWKIVELVGTGAFSSVYNALNLEDGENYALKMEPASHDVKLLKMDQVVLATLGDKGRDRHFCRMHSWGRSNGAIYISMDLVGPSLHTLRQGRLDNRFSLATAMGAGIQMLEALEDLHAVGFLHRDVKPENFTIGREEKGEAHKIYLIDYSMARRYEGHDSRIHQPRDQIPFRGTLPYASLRAQRGRDQGRRDDVESWFNSLIDITAGALPWDDYDNMLAAKEGMRTSAEERKQALRGCPAEFTAIFKHIVSLSYYEEPDYSLLYCLLRKVLEKAGLYDDRYDWETLKQPGDGPAEQVHQHETARDEEHRSSVYVSKSLNDPKK